VGVSPTVAKTTRDHLIVHLRLLMMAAGNPTFRIDRTLSRRKPRKTFGHVVQTSVTWLLFWGSG